MSRTLPGTSLFLIAATLCSECRADDYYDIGDVHQQVSTKSEEAQTWFDRGLAMCFGFNHEEGVRCFERALKADPGCAMAHWGIAYAWGPNMNNMEIEAHQIAQAQHAIHLAELLNGDATNFEKALIGGLAKRYAVPVPEDRDPLNTAYAKAMKDLHENYPDSALATVLYAESLMNLQPWGHWDRDGKKAEHTDEIVRVLERSLQRWPDSPGLCHLYIHVMEMSPTPEKALPAADRLQHAVAGSGHLLHMPSHIYMRVGDYERVIDSNAVAINVDDDYVQDAGPYNFYSLYRIHNYHFLVYGAMFEGRSDLALKTARALTQQVPEDMLKQKTDFLDAFMPTPLHVLVRFGKWEEILDEPEPPDYLPMSRAMRRYARGLAFAATKRVAEAEQEQRAFREALKKVPETSFLFQNPSLSILDVADAMLDGEIAYRKGEYETAFERLRAAVRLDDGLNYDEPWGWMQPARHALGALLLEQGRVKEAEDVYRTDLERLPNNAWSLHGLSEALRRQGKTSEAEAAAKQFQQASARADVHIDRSCFCRIEDR